MADMVRIFNTACKEWWLPGHGSGMTKNIEEAWVLPLEQAEALTTGATVLIFEPVGPTPTTPDELLTARASEARLREALEIMVKSAVPHPVEHPTMTEAWKVAREALSGSTGEWLKRQLSEAVAAERERAEKAEATWRCFHCGFKTDDAKVAEAHFGDVDEEEPICRSWERMNADEKVGAFQGALQEIASEQEENSQLRSKLEKAEAERDALLGNPKAVHQGALAAIEAMKQMQGNAEKIQALQNEAATAGIRLAMAEAERDGLAAVIANEHGAEYVSNPDLARILAARDARITTEARRKALLEAAAECKRDGNAVLAAELEQLAQEADHA